jgi:hypothetical protein
MFLCISKYFTQIYINYAEFLLKFFYGIPLVKILGPPLDIMGSEVLMCPGLHSVLDKHIIVGSDGFCSNCNGLL